MGARSTKVASREVGNTARMPGARAGAKYLGCPPRFDPAEGVTVREPLQQSRGWWAVAPTAYHDDTTGTFYLYYRLRKPCAPGRGVMCRVAAGSDGLDFADVWQASKEELNSPSVEKPCIFRLPDGTWQL